MLLIIVLISILTLFPEIFVPFFSASIIGRAQKNNLVKIDLINIRDFAFDRHKTVDDKPYGGGTGMILRVDVVEKAIRSARLTKSFWEALATPESDSGQARMTKNNFKEKVILLDPKGKQFNQLKARSFSKLDHLILVCGHYEGIDERISHFVDEKISIGDYVLTGGELPAMVISDSVIRLIPKVLSRNTAVLNESFGEGNYLEEPQYTRPPYYKRFGVPKILLSGNHLEIQKWRENHRKLLK